MGRCVLCRNRTLNWIILISKTQLLDDVHNSFFEAYDSKCRDNTKSNGKTGKRSDKSRTQVVKHDVTVSKFILKQRPKSQHFYVQSIIPRIRMDTFKGVHILFSGVIPTNIMMDHEKTDIWKTACAFGAVCHKDLTDEVTHVVTSKVFFSIYHNLRIF